MKSVQKLTLDRSDIKAAILYWIENYHGMCYDETVDDRVHIPAHQTPITVTIKDELA